MTTAPIVVGVFSTTTEVHRPPGAGSMPRFMMIHDGRMGISHGISMGIPRDRVFIWDFHGMMVTLW